MYVNPFDPSNPLPTILFAGVAVGGMAAALGLFRLANSEVAQGDRLVKEGRYADALPHYERAIRMVRRPSYAWTSRGVAMKYLGRLDEALRCHENAIRLDARNEVAWCNLGTVYFRKDQLAKAIECYEEQIKQYDAEIAYAEAHPRSRVLQSEKKRKERIRARIEAIVTQARGAVAGKPSKRAAAATRKRRSCVRSTSPRG